MVLLCDDVLVAVCCLVFGIRLLLCTVNCCVLLLYTVVVFLCCCFLSLFDAVARVVALWFCIAGRCLLFVVASVVFHALLVDDMCCCLLSC